MFQTGKTSARVDSPGTSSSHAPRISMKRRRKTVIVLCLDRGLEYHNYSNIALYNINEKHFRISEYYNYYGQQCAEAIGGQTELSRLHEYH